MPKSLQKTSGVTIEGEASGPGKYPLAIACDKYTTAEAAKKMKRPKAEPAKSRSVSANVKMPRQSSFGDFVAKK